ncbi:MAG: hypothetical protein U0903_08805 [Planctomycetales bacterium]
MYSHQSQRLKLPKEIDEGPKFQELETCYSQRVTKSNEFAKQFVRLVEFFDFFDRSPSKFPTSTCSFSALVPGLNDSAHELPKLTVDLELEKAFVCFLLLKFLAASVNVRTPAISGNDNHISRANSKN